MLYLHMTQTGAGSSGSLPSTSYHTPSPPISNGAGAPSVAGAPNLSVVEDQVDILLDKLDGRIERKKNETM